MQYSKTTYHTLYGTRVHVVVYGTTTELINDSMLTLFPSIMDVRVENSELKFTSVSLYDGAKEEVSIKLILNSRPILQLV